MKWLKVLVSLFALLLLRSISASPVSASSDRLMVGSTESSKVTISIQAESAKLALVQLNGITRD